MTQYFTIITPPPYAFDKVLEYTNACLKSKISLMIKEHGKNGTHEHLNIIWTLKIGKTSDVNRMIHNSFAKHDKEQETENLKLPYNMSNLCRTKKITNLSTLVRLYLSKEDNREILIDDKTIDYKKMENEERVVKKRQSYWTSVLSFIESPCVIINYCNEENIPIPKTITSKWIRYVFQHMTYHGKICVIQLLRHIDDIVEIVQYMVQNPETISS
jgi:hypothetical protein